ncbi:MAG: deoxyribodipyrimidine photo-lyase [Solirubrobacterales bacterium]|nr:deoxyribodipyrimidine photo-lyase [Solirubrobacterales bacterium]
MDTAILWLRRDLRLSDHPALAAALEGADSVVPVFCLDPRLLHGRHRSGPRTQFLLESLQDLERGLEQRGSGLVVRHGEPERELPRLAQELRAARVHATADVSPLAVRRDRDVHAALDRAGIALHLHPGLFVADEPAAILTQSGSAYTVFTPFYRAWLRAPRRSPLPPPERLPELPSGIRREQVPRLEDLGLKQEVERPASGGQTAAERCAKAFLGERVNAYGSERDILGSGGSSGLSPYLHLGCLSARELESRLPLSTGAQQFRRQLCWRDFYAQLLRTFPANARSEHQRRYRGAIRWSRAQGDFEAWCRGRTGYPVVDAAMRQLLQEGWMHNRARLIVGSFLTKDLGIDWRWGERWFMRMLIDGDEANNNGNWQWIASVGVDPQPVPRRIYNPTRQQARFDPDGTFVRRYVPELAQVPAAYLAEPWTMPEHVQTQAGCRIGHDYPAPIVDHAQARRGAIERYRQAG